MGGEAARQLAAANLPFRALVRDAGKAEALQKLGAELCVGDIAERGDVERALDGVDKALLVLPNLEQQFEWEKQFTDVAVASGLKHLAYVSSLESLPESTNPITQIHVQSENYIKASGTGLDDAAPDVFHADVLRYDRPD